MLSRRIGRKPGEAAGESAMGAVRVKARLTNAIDEGLLRRGMIEPAQVRTCEVDALVDTGAVRTVLPRAIVDRLGLQIERQQTVGYADGRAETAGVTEPVKVELLGRDTVEASLMLGDEVLIGQTILEALDLFVDCARGRLVPNPAHPDHAVYRV
jgi:clan AA aspartic protease